MEVDEDWLETVGGSFDEDVEGWTLACSKRYVASGLGGFGSWLETDGGWYDEDVEGWAKRVALSQDEGPVRTCGHW